MSTISASTTLTTAYKVTADTTGTLVLQTGATPTTAVTIDGSQNVGIGNSPTAAYTGTKNFQVGQTQYIFANNGNAGGGFIGNAYLDASAVFKYATNGAATYYNNQAGLHTWSYAVSGTAGNTVSFTEAMRIDSSGNLLVGTTSQLDSGSICLQKSGASSNGIVIKDTNAGGGNQIKFLNSSGTTVGYINQNGTLTVYNTVSDYRLKENVQPMQGALATVAQLKPCTYSWKSTGESTQGFIAHELQDVVPECVTGEKDAVETYLDEDGVEQTRPVYQGIDTSFLVATLTAAIQELKAELDAAKTDIETLKGAA